MAPALSLCLSVSGVWTGGQDPGCTQHSGSGNTVSNIDRGADTEIFANLQKLHKRMTIIFYVLWTFESAMEAIFLLIIEVN